MLHSLGREILNINESVYKKNSSRFEKSTGLIDRDITKYIKVYISMSGLWLNELAKQTALKRCTAYYYL